MDFILILKPNGIKKEKLHSQSPKIREVAKYCHRKIKTKPIKSRCYFRKKKNAFTH